MIVKLNLNSDQAESLKPVLERQKDRTAGAILGVIDRVHDHVTGTTAPRDSMLVSRDRWYLALRTETDTRTNGHRVTAVHIHEDRLPHFDREYVFYQSGGFDNTFPPSWVSWIAVWWGRPEIDYDRPSPEGSLV